MSSAPVTIGHIEVSAAEGKHLSCRDCKSSFILSDTEADFFSEKGLDAPVRCGQCRKARKAKKLMLECCKCETMFEHPESEQKFFKTNGWSQPTRCGPCRKAKKAASLSPITLNCGDCK